MQKSPVDYRERILALLQQREPGKTICPSELLVGQEKQDVAMMEDVRQSARELAKEGQIEITQGGKAVDPDSFRGPIRLRKRQNRHD